MKKIKQTNQSKGKHIEGYKSVFYRHEVADNLQAQWEAGRNGVNDVDKLFELADELYKQGCKDLEKAYIKNLKANLEKQERWRKELYTKWYLWNYNPELGSYTTCGREIEDFISQLLCEREEELKKRILKDFKKYERDYIKNVSRYGIPDSLIEDTLENVEEELYNLLKVEE